MNFSRNAVFAGFLLLLMGLMAMPVLGAQPDDTRQPITIEADRAELDERNQISIYTGNVIVKQGGITVEADEVTVYTRNGELDQIKAEGDPVNYEQIRIDEEDIRGRSKHLEYDANTRILILTTAAELWQGNNHFSGEHIQYDPDQQKVVATGAPATDNSTGQRVHIILQPKSEQDNTKQ